MLTVLIYLRFTLLSFIILMHSNLNLFPHLLVLPPPPHHANYFTLDYLLLSHLINMFIKDLILKREHCSFKYFLKSWCHIS